MPFEPPFRDKFQKGDLIYGLSQEIIKRYSTKIEFFEDAKIHYDNKDYPPITIASYLIPSEIRNMNNYIKNHKDSENPECINRMNFAKEQLQYIENEKYKKYKKNYFNHLRLNEKYRSVTESEKYTDQLLGRKSKGGLSWVTIGNDLLNNQNNQLTRDMHVHFILDGLEMESIVNKSGQFKDSITGKELRWIFRNRQHPNVAARIQFWKNNCPTSAPWRLNPIWRPYLYHLAEKKDRRRAI
ncbi:hypothetical protein J8V57_19340 [Xenorhabdus sp. PB61.4]|uniref:hypothetical protein n=1 Tax=Xenorhabdus sp. PB61.4 TaxID=2788940 RepID=UPI001E5F9E71|nr:hypothetical protein [Xenorhabdus sp. PB61.4]MCC8368355.1 hypothetical protein [Xenorhabdus sp. PB61.4]